MRSPVHAAKARNVAAPPVENLSSGRSYNRNYRDATSYPCTKKLRSETTAIRYDRCARCAVGHTLAGLRETLHLRGNAIVGYDHLFNDDSNILRVRAKAERRADLATLIGAVVANHATA
jgi:hypothetical protein